MQSETRVLTPAFLLVILAGLCYFLSIGALLPVLPRFVEDQLLGGSIAVGVGVGSFAVGAVAIRPFAGRIGDETGRRVLVIAGGLIAGVSSLLYHFSSSLPALVGARLVAGVGEALFFVGAATMIADLAPVERRGEAISYWSVAVYGGLAFGPFLGETVLDGDHFGRVWTLSALLAASAGLLGLVLRETKPQIAIGDSARERTSLFHRAAMLPGVVLFLGLIGLAGFAEFVPLYVDDIDIPDSRAVFLLYGGLILVVRILGARLPDRIGPLMAGTLATGGVAIGMVLMAAIAEPLGLYGGTVVFSLGMSLLYPSMLMMALVDVPDSERGSAVGTVSTFFDLSQGVGAVLLGVVAALSGYRGAFLAGGISAMAGMLLLRRHVEGSRAISSSRVEPIFGDPTQTTRESG